MQSHICLYSGEVKYAVAKLHVCSYPNHHDVFTCFRFLRAMKYTSACLFIFVVFVVMGLFIPFDGPPKDGTTKWKEIEEIIMDNIMMDGTMGDNLLVFLLNVLSVIGMMLLIVYTAYGMSAIPCGMIQGQRTVYTDRNSIAKEIEDIGIHFNNIY